jgi:hypothetical protein
MQAFGNLMNPDAIEKSADAWDDMGKSMQAFGNIMESVRDKNPLLNQQLGAKMNAINRVSIADYYDIAKALERIKKEQLGWAYAIRDTAKATLAQGLTDFFSALGKGGDDLRDFSEKFGQLVQQLAASVGKLMITAGLEKIILNPLNPEGWALLAAGGGVAMVGAAITNNAPSQPSSNLSGTTVGGSSGPKTIVHQQITVQGSIWTEEQLARSVFSRVAKW